MKIKLYIILFFLLLSFPVTAKTLRLTYEQCVEIALRNNNQILSAGYSVEQVKAKALEASPGVIPIVKYEYRLAPVPRDIDDLSGSFFSGDISVLNAMKVEVGIPITTFGKLQTAQELASIGIDASWFQKQKTEDDVVFKIYQIYQGIVLARDLLELAAQAKDSIHKKISQMEKEEVVDQIAILKLKLVYYEVERKVEEAVKKESLALAALKVQLGYESDVDIDIIPQDLKPVSHVMKPLNYYIEIARGNRPEYKLLESGVQAKEKQLKLEGLNFAPNLGVGGIFDIGRAPGITGGDDENSYSNPFNYTKAGVGFQLKGEFDYVKTNSKIKAAQADLMKMVYDKKAAIRGLELDIQQTWLDMKSYKSLMEKAEAEKKAAQQILFLTKSNIEIGVGDKKDYEDALQSFLIFDGRRLEACYNYNVAVAELKKKIGILIDRTESQP